MDLHFQHKTAFASGATTTTYFNVPFKSTLRSVGGVVQDDPGEAETITVTGGGTVASGAAGATNALGILTFGSGIAAGAKGTWAEDGTTGDMTLVAGSLLKLETSSADAAVDVDVDIELDPYAR